MLESAMSSPRPIPRADIIEAVSSGLREHPAVLAGWEGGSAAFGAVDAYSDIDLTFLVEPEASIPEIFEAAERALERMTPIASCYHEPPGPWVGITQRYYRFTEADAYLLLDLALLRTDAPDHFLEVERHGEVLPLFDKAGTWLRPRAVDAAALQARRDKRRKEIAIWFPMSQNFVIKSILRGDPVYAIACYQAITLRPLVELLRMRDCPLRWDFGLRYLDRDLAPEDSSRLKELVFVRDLEDLRRKHAMAEAWALSLLQDVS